MDAKEEIKDVISEVIAEPKFSARGVLWLTLSIFWKNPLLYLSIACITAIPAIALALLTDLKFGMRVGAYAGGALWMIFVKPIAYTVYKEILGERVRIGEAMRFGLSCYGSLLGIYTVSSVFSLCMDGIGESLGYIGGCIDSVGTLYCHCVFAVITQACVVERLGIKQSFLRSATLTKGCRWAIFRLLLLGALPFIFLILCRSFFTPIPFTETENTIAAMGIFSIPITAFYAAGGAVLYYQLRSLKEGVAIGELERVFE